MISSEPIIQYARTRCASRFGGAAAGGQAAARDHHAGLLTPLGGLSAPAPSRTPWILSRQGTWHRKRSYTSARTFGSTCVVRPTAARTELNHPRPPTPTTRQSWAWPDTGRQQHNTLRWAKPEIVEPCARPTDNRTAIRVLR